MSIEDNKAIFRRLIEDWNQGNLDLADELFTPDSFSPSAPDLPPGPQGTKVIAGMFLKAFPDLHITIEHEVADGDRVFGHLRQRGTHTGALVTPAGEVPRPASPSTSTRWRSSGSSTARSPRAGTTRTWSACSCRSGSSRRPSRRLPDSR